MDFKTSFLNDDLEEEAPKHNGVIICLYVNDMLIFGTDQDQVDKTKEFLLSNFSMKDMGEADVILGIRIKREDKVLEGYYDASWITNSEDHTSTTGWVFLLGGGAISWASKKQTCITDSTMEAEFVALAAAGKEAEWLRNLIYEISLWQKLISLISIHCDSAATLAKAYCQISGHLGVRHSMVRDFRGFCSISTKLGGSLDERISPRLSAQVGYRDGIQIHRNL
ncbi:zinc finger, CCHC-type containing protein [Tanacetum coccineum]|uniref:Zinc finger, CCHC-type containing protein n=1 Tax=Tanacetum coccineum TaxID=301880 RepID=A0ABQ4XRZ1_9ASTR